MAEKIDWLFDPLTDINKSYLYATMKNLDSELNDKWAKYHFSTRVKLEALDYFCRQIIGVTSIPSDVGLSKMARRLIIWNLDAFFFEMVAAHERLMQELNILYGRNDKLSTASVNWHSIKDNFMDRIPQKLVMYVDQTVKKDWFRKIRWYRDAATQHRSIMGESRPIKGSKKRGLWDWDDFTQYITFIDGDTGEIKEENVNKCYDYYKKMVEYITTVWKEMAKERRK